MPVVFRQHRCGWLREKVSHGVKGAVVEGEEAAGLAFGEPEGGVGFFEGVEEGEGFEGWGRRRRGRSVGGSE